MARLVPAFALALASCGGAANSVSPPAPAPHSNPGTPGSASPIKHVVIVIQENRTFNDFFATFPGTDGTTQGKIAKDATCNIAQNETIALTKSDLVTSHDLNHSYQGYRTARDGGAMDDFDMVPSPTSSRSAQYPYQYTDPAQIAPYWDMAKRYVLAEHMFTTQGSSSFTAHQDLIAGGTVIEPGEALVNLPSCAGSKCVWGCDAPKGTHTSLITQDDEFQPGQGPSPCLSYETLRDLLDAAKVSWTYYVPKMCCTANGKLFSAFDAIKAVRYGPQWKKNVVSPQTKIFSDVKHGRLAAVSWLIPNQPDSDHPGEKVTTDHRGLPASSTRSARAPTGTRPRSWSSGTIGAASTTTSTRRSWDYGGLGFRVPALIVSSYAKKGYVSTTQYEFGSILKYIEKNWNLGSLGTSDRRANSIIDVFDYSKGPRPFKHIASSLSKTYFLREQQSYLPIDTDL